MKYQSEQAALFDDGHLGAQFHRKKRDVQTCAVCSKERPVEWHHVVPRSCGGTNHASNMLPLCVACHDAVDRCSIDNILNEMLEGIFDLWSKFGVSGRIALLKMHSIVQHHNHANRIRKAKDHDSRRRPR